jgi:prepilin-type N-terminal cleavage/methylation domain-containing protein
MNTSRGFTIVELLIVIVVIAVLAAITIVAFNGIQDRAKTAARSAELAQWKKKSELYKVQAGITCPDNYVFVYGNATLGTSDFCVMKYEARILGNDVGTTTYSASMVVDSRPTGTPWVNITQTNAIAEAAATCSGCQLLTEAQWMTIAADVLSVKYNWRGNAVGSGYIYSGHNDNSPANGLAATTDDADGYNGTGNTGDNQRRTLYLTSGDTIWDIAGNMFEWTNATIAGGAQPGLSGESAYTVKEWNNGSLLMNGLPTISRPVTIGASSYNSNQGIGQLYSNYGEGSLQAIRRGGRWNSGAGAGILSLLLDAAPSFLSTSIGFRVAR